LDKQLRYNLEEIALAVSTQDTTAKDAPEYFDRGDDTILLDLGFKYIDSVSMKGVVDGVTWWVDIEAKRAPRWSFSIEGMPGVAYIDYGPMLYWNITDGLRSVSNQLKEKYRGN
jgi:hypothetical protein